MNPFIYKMILQPVRLTKRFNHGIPYTFEVKMRNSKPEYVWYFNLKDPTVRNTKSTKFVGYWPSLKRVCKVLHKDFGGLIKWN